MCPFCTAKTVVQIFPLPLGD